MKKIMILLLFFYFLNPISILFAETISSNSVTYSNDSTKDIEAFSQQTRNVETESCPLDGERQTTINTIVDEKKTYYVELGEKQKFTLTTQAERFIVTAPISKFKKTSEREEVLTALTDLSKTLKISPEETSKTELYKKTVDNIHWRYNSDELMGYYVGIPFSIVLFSLWIFLFIRLCLVSKKEVIYDDITNKPIKVINHFYNDDLTGSERDEINVMRFIFGLIFFVFVLISVSIIF